MSNCIYVYFFLSFFSKHAFNIYVGVHRTLVFVQQCREADLLSLWLSQQNVKATTINGYCIDFIFSVSIFGLFFTYNSRNREQGQREKALKDFRDGDAYVLVSTDVCARGIDIKHVDHVSTLEGRGGPFFVTSLSQQFFNHFQVINYDLPDDHVIYVHRVGRTGRVKGF